MAGSLHPHADPHPKPTPHLSQKSPQHSLGMKMEENEKGPELSLGAFLLLFGSTDQ